VLSKFTIGKLIEYFDAALWDDNLRTLFCSFLQVDIIRNQVLQCYHAFTMVESVFLFSTDFHLTSAKHIWILHINVLMRYLV